MRSPTIVPLLALLAIAASGCGSDTPEATGEDPTASAPASAPANAPGAAGTTDAEAQPFDSPTVAEQATTTPATGLIGSTNSKERAIQVQRNIQANQKKTGGSNPFGILPVKTTSDLPEGSLTVANGGSTPKAGGPPLPPLTPQSGEPTPDLPFPTIPLVSSIPYIPPLEISPQGRAPQSPPASTPSAPSRSTPSAPTPATRGSSPAAAPPSAPNFEPPPPSTVLAESIEVLGVVQVGREVQILVRTPDSPLGRYVAVGETVANGQVLIRRVERLQGGGEPVVILVQNGIEVARIVGDTPNLADGDTTANALNDASTIRNSGQHDRLRSTNTNTIASRTPLPPLPVPYAP
jgi:hypothetical protein